ncbi:MAG: hypothetical protein BWY17_03405 [Deltaproteobacteria bacterium ADurb.Bin207]|jgi:hypothetical protein|nr:MAG: hypothetical protein BWY17_03405 [Deltaproteobacteria bacterium ADurb.Bin207]
MTDGVRGVRLRRGITFAVKPQLLVGFGDGNSRNVVEGVVHW